ncbi:MAG: hypothetical protein H7257_10310, partial [Taibaiella sp.]|nr:hypothetical protein [Taibaiella sp.]
MKKLFFLFIYLLLSTVNAISQVHPGGNQGRDTLKFIDEINLRDTASKKETVLIRKESKPVTDTVTVKDTAAVVKRKLKDTLKAAPVVIDPYQLKTYQREIPFNRRYFHEDKIDKELKRADLSDGVADKKIAYLKDTSLSSVITKAILKDAAFLQIMVENMPANGRDSFADHQERIRCLNAINRMLLAFNGDPEMQPMYYKKLVANMHDMLIAFNENKLASFTVKNTNIYTLENSKILYENYKDLRPYLYTRLGAENPLLMMMRLPEFAYDTFAAAIVSKAAPLIPEVIFNYATSTNAPLTYAVHHTNDPFVQAIVTIADKSKSPLKAMAFLGDIYHGTKTIAQIDVITSDADLYFKNLVRLKVTDDSIGRVSYAQELGVRALRYVREMNELHEATDAVRFKILEDLTTAELYYIMVYGQDEIYTSSFLGSFKRLMEKMKPMKGNQLLESLHFDHFRTFIRMCAGYNTLSDFLVTMDDTSRSVVMASFINNLQKGREDDLEDAVDVADAFGSIADTVLAAFLKNKVKESYEVSYKERSRKGMIIYSLLARLFEGNKTVGNDTGAALLSEKLGLNNINTVPFKDLLNDSGII